MNVSALLILPVQLQIWLVTLSAEQQIFEQINVLLFTVFLMNHLCSKKAKKKKKSFCHLLLKTSGFAGILKVIYLVLVQIDKEKKSIPFPSVLLSFLCQKPECWMEVRTVSNLPENLPVLCHPVNTWFSSLVWFCKNSLQQQSVGFAKLFHLQWVWKQLPR